MSGFCVGVNGGREAWYFVCVGGGWKGFSFRRTRDVISVSVCGDGS